MTVSAVVLDFGNVLGLFSHRRAAEQLAAYSPLSAEAIQAYLFGSRLEDDYESGRLSTDVVCKMIRETCRLRCTDEELARAFADMFAPNPDVCALVPRLKRHQRLVLLSNTNELHSRQFLAQFADVLAPFDYLVLSHAIGVRKPDPRAYEHCRRLAGCPAAECVFVDDLPTNVEAARACGWQGLVYRRGDDLAAGLERLGAVLTPANGRKP